MIDIPAKWQVPVRILLRGLEEEGRCAPKLVLTGNDGVMLSFPPGDSLQLDLQSNGKSSIFIRSGKPDEGGGQYIMKHGDAMQAIAEVRRLAPKKPPLPSYELGLGRLMLGLLDKFKTVEIISDVMKTKHPASHRLKFTTVEVQEGLRLYNAAKAIEKSAPVVMTPDGRIEPARSSRENELSMFLGFPVYRVQVAIDLSCLGLQDAQRHLKEEPEMLLHCEAMRDQCIQYNRKYRDALSGGDEVYFTVATYLREGEWILAGRTRAIYSPGA